MAVKPLVLTFVAAAARGVAGALAPPEEEELEEEPLPDEDEELELEELPEEELEAPELDEELLDEDELEEEPLSTTTAAALLVTLPAALVTVTV